MTQAKRRVRPPLVAASAAAGCVVHVNPDAIVGLGATAGSMEIGMPLPNTLSLAGAVFQQQLVVAETGLGGGSSRSR